MLPPDAEEAVADVDDPVAAAAEHPQRREVRMAVGVMRDGSREACPRACAAQEDADDERVTGTDLVPGLADALLATLEE